jgi:hypothetical protein
MHRAPIFLAVHRFEDLVYYRRIEQEAFRLLTALRDGSSILEAIGNAFADTKFGEDRLAVKVQEYFAHAAELGWFCRPDDESTHQIVM